MTLNQPNYQPDWLKQEVGPREFTREKITVQAGSGSARVLTHGMVLGKATLGAATSAAKAGGNTGDGTLTLDATTPVKTGAKVGVYRVRFIATAANNGTFIVEDPDGIQIGTIVMAGGSGTFDDVLKFVIADAGSDDFIVGDGFDITVAAGTGQWVQLNLTALNGQQNAAGILALDATAPDGATVQAVAIVRNSVVVSGKLVWPAGITTDQKSAALAQLKALGIVDNAAA